jgi:hypothetical protein
MATPSIRRVRGRYGSMKGFAMGASVRASQGMAASTGGAVAKAPEAAMRLWRCVVPLLGKPTMKVGGATFVGFAASTARSSAVKGSRTSEVANATP